MKSIPLGRSLGEAVQESGPRSQSVCYVLWALRFRQLCVCGAFCKYPVFMIFSILSLCCTYCKTYTFLPWLISGFETRSRISVIQSWNSRWDWEEIFHLSRIIENWPWWSFWDTWPVPALHWLTQLSWHLLFVFKVVLQFEGKNHWNRKTLFVPTFMLHYIE